MTKFSSERREFTLQSALLLLSGVAITVSGCGGSSPSSPNPPASGDISGTVSSNHGHTAVITAAQITTGGALQLNIQGSSTHTHTVELTGGDLASIGNRQRVSKESSTSESHSHTVTFN